MTKLPEPGRNGKPSWKARVLRKFSRPRPMPTWHGWPPIPVDHPGYRSCFASAASAATGGVRDIQVPQHVRRAPHLRHGLRLGQRQSFPPHPVPLPQTTGERGVAADQWSVPASDPRARQRGASSLCALLASGGARRSRASVVRVVRCSIICSLCLCGGFRLRATDVKVVRSLRSLRSPVPFFVSSVSLW